MLDGTIRVSQAMPPDETSRSVPGLAGADAHVFETDFCQSSAGLLVVLPLGAIEDPSPSGVFIEHEWYGQTWMELGPQATDV